MTQRVSRFVKFFFIMYTTILCTACNRNNDKKLFELMPSAITGITFNNRLIENDTFNVIHFDYIYNGAGVATGDVNNDGLTDVYFAGNMVSGKLYLNRGDFRFEDVTHKAGLQTTDWCTGVSMADVNQDGLLDIYISTIQPLRKAPDVPNLLYINTGADANGTPSFVEAGKQTGLADLSYATHAAFLDYDLDGDLDVYLLTNALEEYNRNLPVGQRHDGSGKSVDKLYRQEGIGANGLPYFRDVSAEAGILWEGWGLGVMVNDINNDGYPDIYVANDFLSNDHLYINGKDGTFSNEIKNMLKHQEHNGMGMDIADINNDGLNDIVVMDMMPDDNLRQKTMFSNIGYDRFMLNQKMGYQDQYIRNVLQLNNGNGTFSDIGYLAGIYATDWSWSSLLADFDNDGFRDLLVTNGYQKDITDLDFVAYRKEATAFGSDKVRTQKILDEIKKLKPVRKYNFIFQNNGDLTFTDKTATWGMDALSSSQGAAYADFDNDGDLDIVINNLNDEAFVYRNNRINGKNHYENNFIRIQLKGNKGNTHGLGAKIRIYAGENLLFAEHQLHRGYKSTVEDIEHFGLGTATVDSVIIVWPSGNTQTIEQPPVNQVLTLQERNAERGPVTIVKKPRQPLFSEVHNRYNLFFNHEEQDFPDFKQGQALLPHKHSQGGPAITTGDINNDGLDDMIIGGAAHYSATIFYQQKDETFLKEPLAVKEEEDMGLLLFDADNDGDLDLYCVSGSSEFGRQSTKYRDRFYRNHGHGKLIEEKNALPEITASGSCVIANDYDKDGDLDLFVGGRVSPGRYPEPARSYLLNNNGAGIFTDVTSSIAADLAAPGMVSAALWTDYDNDGWTDLLVMGEWMPITFFRNLKGVAFRRQYMPSLQHTEGWWNSVAGGDFDNDGDIDYIAGNLGLNSLLKASVHEPVCIYAKDYDDNGSLDPVLCRFIYGSEYPIHPRETLTEQITPLKKRLTHYSVYGSMSFQEIFSPQQLAGAIAYKSSLFASVYIENQGGNRFSIKHLPIQAQISPVFGIRTGDFNDDANLDVLLIGNSYASDPLTGYYDAGIGTCLMGEGNGNFAALTPTQSGFFINGDAKAFSGLTTAGNKSLFVVTQNRDSLKAFVLNNEHHTVIAPAPHVQYAELMLGNGKKRKHEFYYGEGYLSASSATMQVNKNVSSIVFYSVKGKIRKEMIER